MAAVESGEKPLTPPPLPSSADRIKAPSLLPRLGISGARFNEARVTAMVLILSKAPGHRKKAEACRAMALSVASPEQRQVLPRTRIDVGRAGR